MIRLSHRIKSLEERVKMLGNGKSIVLPHTFNGDHEALMVHRKKCEDYEKMGFRVFSIVRNAPIEDAAMGAIVIDRSYIGG